MPPGLMDRGVGGAGRAGNGDFKRDELIDRGVGGAGRAGNGDF